MRREPSWLEAFDRRHDCRGLQVLRVRSRVRRRLQRFQQERRRVQVPQEPPGAPPVRLPCWADVGAITEVELSIAVDADQTGAQWSMSGMSIQKTTIEKVNNNWTVSPVKGNKVYVSGGKVRSGANDDNKVLTADLSGTTTNGVREGALKAGGDCSANADCESGKCGNVDGTINPTLANG